VLDFQDQNGGVSRGSRGGDGGPGEVPQGVRGGSRLAEPRWRARVLGEGAQLGWTAWQDATTGARGLNRMSRCGLGQDDRRGNPKLGGAC